MTDQQPQQPPAPTTPPEVTQLAKFLRSCRDVRWSTSCELDCDQAEIVIKGTTSTGSFSRQFFKRKLSIYDHGLRAQQFIEVATEARTAWNSLSHEN